MTDHSPISPEVAKLNLGFKRRISKSRKLTDDVELENIFREFGLSLIQNKQSREVIFSSVRGLWQGKKPEILSQKALDFLVQEFDAEIIQDENNRTIINFPQQKPKGDEMSLINEVAERSGQKRSVVKEVYEALLKTIRITLKKERRIRLPDFAVVKVSYRKPRERAKKWNPFEKKKTWVEARPASNKLKISPIKKMKDWCAEKVEVVEPEKKKKKK